MQGIDHGARTGREQRDQCSHGEYHSKEKSGERAAGSSLKGKVLFAKKKGSFLEKVRKRTFLFFQGKVPRSDGLERGKVPSSESTNI